MTKEEYAVKHIEDNYDAIDEEMAYDAFLDEVYPKCSIAGYEYQTSRVLAEVDPTAYRCSKDDWLDGEFGDGNLAEIAAGVYEREAGEKLDEINDALKTIVLHQVTGKDLIEDKFSHSDLDERPTPDDFDTRIEYLEALAKWRDAVEDLAGWHWQNEGGELIGPFDSEEEAWEDAAGI